jgi:hypothetical protein
VQHHIIGTFQRHALSSFVQPVSCAVLHTPGRKSEDVWIVFPLASKKLEHLELSMASIGFSEEGCFS